MPRLRAVLPWVAGALAVLGLYAGLVALSGEGAASYAVLPFLVALMLGVAWAGAALACRLRRFTTWLAARARRPLAAHERWVHVRGAGSGRWDAALFGAELLAIMLVVASLLGRRLFSTYDAAAAAGTLAMGFYLVVPSTVLATTVWMCRAARVWRVDLRTGTSRRLGAPLLLLWVGLPALGSAAYRMLPASAAGDAPLGEDRLVFALAVAFLLLPLAVLTTLIYVKRGWLQDDAARLRERLGAASVASLFELREAAEGSPRQPP